MRLKIVLLGASGRMGQAVLKAADAFEIDVVQQISGSTKTDIARESYDVIIDFSSPEGSMRALDFALKDAKAIIIGSTGHNLEQQNLILKASTKIPLLKASNFSIGINTLFYLARKATEKLPREWQAEIIEMHHNCKKDAPGGTAKDIAQTIASTRNLDNEVIKFGRSGNDALRTQNEIGIHAIRAGNITGEHTVLFAGENERIEIKHTASDRSIYAHGALKSATWIINKPAGLYSMLDVLDLKD